MAGNDTPAQNLLSVEDAQGLLNPLEETKSEKPKLISVDEASAVLKPEVTKPSGNLISVNEAENVLKPEEAPTQIPSAEQRIATEDPMNLSEGTKFLLQNETDGKTLSKWLETNPGIDTSLSDEQHREIFKYHRSPDAPSTWEETKKGVGGMAEMGGKFLNTATEDVLKTLGLTANDWSKTGSPKAEDKARFVSSGEEYLKNLGEVRKDAITGLDELVSGVQNAWNWGKLHGQGGFSWWDQNGENSGYNDSQGVYHPWQTEEQSFHNHKIRTQILGEQARRQRVTPSGFGSAATALNTTVVPTPEENQANNPGMTYAQAQDKTWKDAAALTKQAAEGIPTLEAALEPGKPEIRLATGLLYAGANPYGLAETGVGMLRKGIVGGERFLANVGRDAEEINAANELRANAIKLSKQKYKAAREGNAGYVPIAQIPESVPLVGGKTISLPTLATTARGIEKAAQLAQQSKVAIPLASTTIGGLVEPEHRGYGALGGLTLGVLGKKIGFKTIEEGAGLVRSAAEAAELIKGGLPSEIMKEIGRAETSSKGARKIFGGEGLPTALSRDGADWIANNAVPFALKGVHGATLAAAMGVLEDTPLEKMPAEIIQGTLMTLVPGLLHHGLTESPNQIRSRAAREDKQIAAAMDGLSPEATQTVEDVGYSTHVDKQKELDATAEEIMQETQQRAAEVAADPNASPKEKAKAQEVAKSSMEARRRQKRKLNQALTASVETRLEYNRQFKLALAHIHRQLNGSLRAGQNNVGIEVLTTQQATDKIIRNTPELAAMNAKGGPFQAEAIRIASDIASQGGASFTPGEGAQLDPSRSTIFINADNLASSPYSAFTALFHEASHAMNKIPEFAAANDDAKKILFTTTRKDLNGNIEGVNHGLLNDRDLTRMFFEEYMQGKSPEEVRSLAKSAGIMSDEDPERIDPKKLVEYMQEEVLADTNAGTLAKTFTEGRPTFEHLRKWAGINTKVNIAKRAVQKVLGLGGEAPKNDWYQPLTGVKMTKELRQASEAAAQALHDLNGAVTSVGEDPLDPVTGKPLRTEPKMTKKELIANRSLLERYGKDSGLVKTQMRAIVTDAQGNPISAPIDIKNLATAEGSWEVAPDGTIKQTRGYGQIPAELSSQTLPPGAQIHVQNQVLTEPDGITPIWNSRKDVKKLVKTRAQLIRDAVTNAYRGEQGAVLAYSADNLSMRGTLTPGQVQAIKDLPETVVPLRLKQHIFRINDAIESGRRQLTEYSTHVGKNGEYTSTAPVVRDNQYIGLHFSKDGNFTGTAVSWDALHRKMRLWSQRLPGRFDLWDGDTQRFYNEFMEKYLPNLNNDMSNDVNLDKDPTISEAKKNVFRDFVGFNNQANVGTYPDRTVIPTKRGERSGEMDNIVRSFRLDAIMDMIDHPAPPVKVPYEKVLKNLMPRPIEAGISFKPSREEEPPIEPFYSQLRNTLQVKVPNKTSAAQLLGIMSSGGVKKDEIRFSGIESQIPKWKEQYGDQIPKEAIDQYLREDGAVNFKDVVLSDRKARNSEEETNQIAKKYGLTAEYDALSEEYSFLDAKGDLVDSSELPTKMLTELVSNQNKLNPQSSNPKYNRPDLVVPGGEYYREIVMTLPSGEDSLAPTRQKLQETLNKIQSSDEEQKKIRAVWPVITERPQNIAEQLARVDAENLRLYDQKYQLEKEIEKGGTGGFTSSHFRGISDYVAHMRLDDRPDANGEPGVFIQEMQNDRAKEARSRGGYQTRSFEDSQRLLETARKFRNEIWSKFTRGEIDIPKSNELLNSLAEENGFTPTEVYDEAQKRGDFTNTYIEPGITEAPFSDPNKYTVALFKRALADAVSRNKKWVGWTGGETQADRYNLAKRVDSISYYKNKDGTYDYDAIKSDNVIHRKTGLDEKGLEAEIGKTLAEKIIKSSSKEGELEGVDLAIGGEWTKNLYDKTAVNSIGDYVKKIGGGKVEPSSLFAEENSNVIIKNLDQMAEDDPYDDMTLRRDIGKVRDLVRNGNSLEKSLNQIKDRSNKNLIENYFLNREMDIKGKETPYWKVPITPEMERIVRTAGQPNFMPKRESEPYDEQKFKGAIAKAMEVLKKPENIPSQIKIVEPYDKGSKIDTETPHGHLMDLLEKYDVGDIQDFGDLQDELRGFLDSHYDARIEDALDNYEKAKKVDRKYGSRWGTLDDAEQMVMDAIDQSIKDFTKEQSVKGPNFMPAAKLDEAHAKAIESGDIEEAQRLVDERAREAGYQTGWYHGTASDTKIKVPAGGRGVSSHLTKDKEAAAEFAKKSKEDFMGENPRIENWSIQGDIFDPRNKTHLLRIIDAVPENSIIATQSDFNPSEWKNYDWGFFEANEDVQQAIRDAGFSGYLDREEPTQKWGNSVAMFYPKDIKSTDPATYDEGKLIPLSQRFDTSKPDIRFMPARDSDYMEAYKVGDEEKEREIIHQIARDAGYNIFGWKSMIGHVPHMYTADKYAVTFMSQEERMAHVFKGPDKPIREVATNASNLFDYRNPAHLKELVRHLRDYGPSKWNKEYNDAMEQGMITPDSGYKVESMEDPIHYAEIGNWSTLEMPSVRKWIAQQGYDGFYVTEDGMSSSLEPNIAVFDPTKIKSIEPETTTLGGAVIPPSYRFDTSRNDVRFMPSSKLDEAYAKTIGFDADPKEARKIVDQTAEKAGYDSSRYWYHGTAGDEFFVPKGRRGVAAHISLNKDEAWNFAESAPSASSRGGAKPNVREWYLKKGELFDPTNEDHLKKVSESIEPVREKIKKQPLSGQWALKEDTYNPNTWKDKIWDFFEDSEIQKFIKDAGFIGYMDRESPRTPWEDTENAAIFDPNSLKEASLITLDDNKNIIPLSQRFDTSKSDIRFMPNADSQGTTVTETGTVIHKDETKPFEISKKAMVNFMPAAPGINLEDYQDRPTIALPCDRMGVGGIYVGPTGYKQKLSVEGQGGPGFIELHDEGIWAFSNEDTAGRFMLRCNDLMDAVESDRLLVAPTLQSPINHLKNPTGQKGYVEGMEAAVKAKILTKKDLDAQINSISDAITRSNAISIKKPTREKWAQIKDWASFKNAVYSKKLNFADTSPYLTQIYREKHPISGKDLKNIGLLPDDIAKDLADPRFFDLPFGSVVALFEVKKNAQPFRTNFHDSYPVLIPGKPIGFLKNIYGVEHLSSEERILNKAGVVQTQPLQTVLPALDRVSDILKDLTITPVIKP